MDLTDKQPIEPIASRMVIGAIDALQRVAWDIAVQKGWHEDFDFSGGIYHTNIGERLALVHSEVSELLEAFRNGTELQNCDKPIELTQLSEELADIVIRCMDIAHEYKQSLGKAIVLKLAYNATRPHKHGGKKF